MAKKSRPRGTEAGEPAWLRRAREEGRVTDGPSVNAAAVAAAATPLRHEAFMTPDAKKRMSEAVFQDIVVGLLDANGWEVYHTQDSRKSREGFPDLTAWRGVTLLFAELKKDGEDPTPDQVRCMEGLSRTGAEVYLWRPSDWPAIYKIVTAATREYP